MVPGIIIVNISIAKNAFLNGKFIFAYANAAIADTSKHTNVGASDVIIVFINPLNSKP